MFLLEILTPERNLYTEEVESVILVAHEGEIEILTGHAPMVINLLPNPVKIKKSGEWITAALAKGFALVNPDKVAVFVDAAEWPDEIDINRSHEAKMRAEERLKQKLSQIEYVHTKIALQRALTRLKVTGRKDL